MYLENYERYLGTGEKNSEGLDLRTFLESYNPKLYDTPANTVDNIIFTYKEVDGKIKLCKLLLIKRGNHPSIGWWALPGGFVDFRENLDTAAARELEEETGIKGLKAVSIGSFGDYDRDPRTRIITTAYVALVEEGKISATAGDDAADAKWFDISVVSQGKETIAENITNEKFRMTFSAEEIKAEATVLVTRDCTGPLTDTKYSMISTGNLSGDHAAIILNAMDYIKKELGYMI